MLNTIFVRLIGRMSLLICLNFVNNSSADASENYPSMSEPLGVGILLGEPTALSGKYWMDYQTAVDAAIGWGFIRETAVQAHVSYLYHFFDLLKSDDDEFLVYVGGGARVKFESRFRFGIRGVGGIEYPLPTTALSFFLEVSPIVDFIPTPGMSFNLGLGGRIFF